jgi:type I restriction enzyme M protein
LKWWNYQGKIFDAAVVREECLCNPKFLESHGGDKKNISIYGQERYDGTLRRLCKMNFALRVFDVKWAILNDKFPDLKPTLSL